MAKYQRAQVDPKCVPDDAPVPKGEAFAVCRVLPVDEARSVKTVQAATYGPLIDAVCALRQGGVGGEHNGKFGWGFTIGGVSIAGKKADQGRQDCDVVACQAEFFSERAYRPQKFVDSRGGNSFRFRQGGSCLGYISHGVSEEKASPFTASGVEIDSFWGYQSGVETD